MEEEKLDSTALRIIQRVAKRFPNATISVNKMVLEDGTETPAVGIKMPVEFKSGRKIFLTLLASEGKPKDIQIARLPFVENGSPELKEWKFPENALDHIKLFIEEYKKRHPDLVIDFYDDGVMRTAYFFVMDNLSDDAIYEQIRLCIGYNLDIDGRLTAAEAGNMDGVIDFIGASKDSNDYKTDKRLSI